MLKRFTSPPSVGEDEFDFLSSKSNQSKALCVSKLSASAPAGCIKRTQRAMINFKTESYKHNLERIRCISDSARKKRHI